MNADPDAEGLCESSAEQAETARHVFATTHWSIVLAARDHGNPAAFESLEKLCRTYWYPLYAYARRTGNSPADAEDLTQGFFARLLEKDYLKAAMPQKGKFRTFLLTSLQRYMANEWDRSHAVKRGGFATRISFDQGDAETRFCSEPAAMGSPDQLYQRQWAVTLLDQTIGKLHGEYVESGRGLLFKALRACLAREDAALSYRGISQQLGLTEPAVKMAVYRLRSRYREILRTEIAQTVSSPDEVEEEIRQLFSSFN